MYEGQDKGVPAKFETATVTDIYPGAIVYARHHSNYIMGKVQCITVDRFIKVQFPLSAPGAAETLVLEELFVKLD